jgi:indolepyruvate ferredoxin oxidoreductase alpha subunit
VILDNSITGMTGHQQNPATGLNIRLQAAPAVDLEALCRAIGVTSIQVVDPADTLATQRALAAAMAEETVSVVITRRPCALIPPGKGRRADVVRLDRAKCTKCKSCIRIMCPALVAGPDGYPQTDPTICNACHLCTKVCRFSALKWGEET